MKDKFTNCKMSWGKVLQLALITAAATAVLKLIPALDGTSFQDPAINPEFWLLCGVFISVNCEKWYEASIKTFAFFLVSQPLIYLIQVPFVPEGFGIFQYYGYWFKITLMTLPAGAAAFFLKKKNLLSALMLAGAAALCGYMGAQYLWNVTAMFPRHLLSLLFCIAMPVFLFFTFTEKKSLRLALILVLALSLGAIAFMTKPTRAVTVYLGEGQWTASVENENIVDIIIEADGSVRFQAKGEGSTQVFLTRNDETGTAVEYYVTVSNGSIMVNEF